jgi:hypothetical protein
MSLPPHVQWVYDHHPEVGSEEEKLLKVLESSWVDSLVWRSGMFIANNIDSF